MPVRASWYSASSVPSIGDAVERAEAGPGVPEGPDGECPVGVVRRPVTGRGGATARVDPLLVRGHDHCHRHLDERVARVVGAHDDDRAVHARLEPGRVDGHLDGRLAVRRDGAVEGFLGQPRHVAEDRQAGLDEVRVAAGSRRDPEVAHDVDLDAGPAATAAVGMRQRPERLAGGGVDQVDRVGLGVRAHPEQPEGRVEGETGDRRVLRRALAQRLPGDRVRGARDAVDDPLFSSRRRRTRRRHRRRQHRAG